MKTRLLLMTLDFPPRQGGVARYLHALALYFKDQITVIASPESHSRTFDQNEEYPIQRQHLLYTIIWPRWLRAISILVFQRHRYDQVLVSHILPLGTAAWLAKYFTRRPYIVLLHGMDASLAKRSRFKKWLTTQVLKNAKLVITNTRALKLELQNDYGLQSVLTVYPPLSVPPSFFSRTRHDHRFHLLTVSRLINRKGHVRVLKALAWLKKQGRLEEFKYHIVGEGIISEHLRQLVEALGLQDHVDFEGFVSDQDLALLYSNCDVFIMPTVADKIDREGFGMVYIEAGFYGLPSIATAHPGVDEAVLDQQTGLLVPDGNIEALAEAIMKLQDKNLRTLLGQNAKRRAISEFTPESQFAKLAEQL
ncbi:glycosyltransferase family 4 protein [Patescibacteria group bacterium]|nr:glycosyltransferase family 4 protein [Patescibacteria group bacterium]